MREKEKKVGVNNDIVKMGQIYKKVNVQICMFSLIPIHLQIQR